MAAYKCGYCGKYNEGDIWCSENHRQLWYEMRRVKNLDAFKKRQGRQGPKGRSEGGMKRGRAARAKKT